MKGGMSSRPEQEEVSRNVGLETESPRIRELESRLRISEAHLAASMQHNVTLKQALQQSRAHAQCVALEAAASHAAVALELELTEGVGEAQRARSQLEARTAAAEAAAQHAVISSELDLSEGQLSVSQAQSATAALEAAAQHAAISSELGLTEGAAEEQMTASRQAALEHGLISDELGATERSLARAIASPPPALPAALPPLDATAPPPRSLRGDGVTGEEAGTGPSGTE